jgi:hypothetical protein
MWWMVDVGFSHVLDENDLTQAQEKFLDLDIQATNIMYRSLDDCIFEEIIDMITTHEIWSYLNEKYGTVSNDDDDDDDEPKEKAHEDVEHDHNLVIVEDCSTSWSSDDDVYTRRSLDKIDDDATSDANDDATPCAIVDNEDDGYESDVSTSSSTTSHCFRSHGDTNVSNANTIDLDSYEELLDRYGRTIKALEKEMAKTKKLKNENSFLKNTCEQKKYLLYFTTCSCEELKLAHEELSVAHDNLVHDHAFLTNKVSNEEIKTSESSLHRSNDQSHNIANLYDVGKKNISTSSDELLAMPCSS